MKKMFSFMLVVLTSLTMSAASLNLDLAEAGSTSWDDATYNAATHTMSWTKAWGGGVGWWLVADYSAYERVVVEFANPIPMQVALTVSYGTEEVEDSYEQAFAPAGATSIEYTLDPAKKSAVQKIYFQAAAAGSIVLKSAVVTGDKAVDPLDGLTGVEVGEMSEPGKTCYLSLAEINEYDYFEIIVTNKTDEAQNGWGIGKIVAVSDWNTPACELLCNNPGAGKDNRFVIAQADMLNYAKKNGTFHTDEYGQQGVHINIYDDKATLKSVKGYVGGDNPKPEKQKTDLGSPDDYGVVYLDLATVNKYEEFEIVIKVTDAAVGKNWGIGKIVPVGYWNGDYFEIKANKDGAVENIITVIGANMLEYAKVNGSFYTDEYDRQGVMIQAYGDKAELLHVYGISDGTTPSSVETVASQNLIEKVGINLYRSAQNILVFNLTGANVLSGTEVDLNALPQGVYVLRSGNQTLKVSR
ncbi:MAG: hypothetical protein IJS73_07675 [Paludibacteraceae bacterium]|nr:hypothetical protein [Paludibacteraceae bacterium]